jgi:hypothetical protein
MAARREQEFPKKRATKCGFFTAGVYVGTGNSHIVAGTTKITELK